MSFTLGNAPSTALVAVSAKGYQFKVEVKTARKNGNSWLVRSVLQDSDLYYMLIVSRPKDDFSPPMYWILTAQEVGVIPSNRERDGKSPQIVKDDIRNQFLENFRGYLIQS